MFVHLTFAKRLFLYVVVWVLVTLAGSGCGFRDTREGAAGVDRMGEDKKLAHELLEAGRFQEVVEILTPWAEKKPMDPQVYSMLAKAQWKLRAYEGAIGNYEKALRLDYSDTYAHLELAQLLVETGKLGRAMTEFELAIASGERDPLAHYNYGLALYGMNRKEEALEQWRIAYSLDQRDSTYAEAMGIGLTGVNDAEALVYFERAMALGADGASFHDNFGLLLQRLGDYSRAETEFKNAVSREPANTVYRRNLAVLYMVSGQFGAAMPLWTTLFEGAPDDSMYRVYLARAHLELGRFDPAIELLEDWIRGPGGSGRAAGDTLSGEAEGPTLDEAYEILAMSYRGKGDLGRAASYMRKALDIQPDRVVYLINYGVILAEDGKIPEARARWERVLQIDPENAAAKHNLSAFKR